MTVNLVPVTANTTRWSVTTLASHHIGAVNLDRNASGGSVPDRIADIVRRSLTRLWVAKDWRQRARKLSIDIWPTQTGTCSGGAYSGTSTVLTAATGTFYASMIGKSVVITGAGAGSYPITAYTSATSVTVTGDASAASASPWTVTADNTYAMPSWVAKLDQRWLRESQHDASSDLRITEDTQTFERLANEWDDDDTGQPQIALVCRDFDRTGFNLSLRVAPIPDDVYQYGLWALTLDPFLSESANDDTVPPWPVEFDEGWELLSALRIKEAFGPQDDVPAAQKAYDRWMQNALAEQNETLTTPAEPILQDGYDDLGKFPSQLRIEGGIWPL